jgi:regulatory associated protein of mTOR
LAPFFDYFPEAEMLTTLIYSGNSSHTVKLFNFDGQELSRVEPYSSFLQNRTAPIAATAFHPHHMVLGCAARGDNHINLFSCSQENADS